MKDEKTECGIRTNVNLVSLEIAPVELLPVQLDQGPIFRKPEGVGGDLDRLGVKHKTDDALVRGGTALSDLSVEFVHLRNPIHRLCHQVQVLVALLSDLGVLSLDRVPQPAEHVVPDFDTCDLVADFAHHGRDGFVVASVTERDDLLARLAVGVTERHTGVGEDRRGTGDVSTGQEGDTVVFAAEAVVEATCALIVDVLEGRDGEAEGWSKGLPELGDVVDERVEWEEPGAADGTGDDRLDEGHLDVEETGLGEDLLDAAGSCDGVLVDEGAGYHTDGEDERAEGLGLPLVGVGEGVNACPPYAIRVEVFIDKLADGEPNGSNRVTVDGARLTNNALGLRALTYRPGRTSLVYTRRTAAVKVAISIGILCGKAGRAGGGSRANGRVGVGR